MSDGVFDLWELIGVQIIARTPVSVTLLVPEKRTPTKVLLLESFSRLVRWLYGCFGALPVVPAPPNPRFDRFRKAGRA